MTQPGRRKGAFFILLLVVFLDMVGFGIIIPFIQFWAERFGAAPDVVTLLFATYSMATFTSSFFWGWLSDRKGRKPVLMVGLLGSAISFAWIGMADALWMLFAARILGGLMSGNIPVAQAYIADVTDPKDRAKSLGMLGAAFGLGFILGPAIGGALAGSDPANLDFQTPFFVAAGVSLLGLIAGLVLLPEPERRRPPRVGYNVVARFRSFSALMASPAIAFSVATIVLMATSMAAMESTFALWTERQFDWGPRQVAYFFVFIGVVLVITQGGLVGRIVRRLGEPRTAVLGAALMVGGFAIVPFASSLTHMLISGALMALGFGLGQPSVNAVISTNAPADRQGEILGASQSAQSLARIAGPICAGILFADHGRNMPYIVATVLLVFAFLLATRIVHHARSTQEPVRQAEAAE